MHINLELLECVYLVSAMLLEIPYMAGRFWEREAWGYNGERAFEGCLDPFTSVPVKFR